MARKSNKQPQSQKNQEAKKSMSLSDKAKLSAALKEIKEKNKMHECAEEQTTFNTDPISELTEEGSVENAV